MIAGAKLEAGPWLKQFTIHGPVACTAEKCAGWAGELPLGSDALDLWHAIQQHMLDKHLGDSETVVPLEFFDELAADDGPAESNECTRRGVARLGAAGVEAAVVRKYGLDRP